MWSSKNIFLLLTIVAAILFGIPHLNQMDLLSQGDHGRDLYAAAQVFNGQLPYKDFWWVYGPIMPYYYAVFFKLLGVNISVMLLGQMFLNIACAVFFYLAAACVMAPAWAFLGALWFIQVKPDFFFTFNHDGGILCGLIILYCVFSYLREGSLRFLYPALICAFIFNLVKINFGMAGLVGLVCSVFAIDFMLNRPFDLNKKKFYLTAIVAVPMATLFIYWLLLKDLPIYAIRQCMPYMSGDQPYEVPPLLAGIYYLQQHWLTFVHSWINALLGIILHGSTVFVIYLLTRSKIPAENRMNLLLSIGICLGFFVLYFHEFIVSGVWYRSYWSLPYLMMLHFIVLSTALPRVHAAVRISAIVFLSGLILFGGIVQWGVKSQQKIPPRLLALERGHVYLGNEPQWTATVNATADFLNKTLKKDELFFALPYDCLYYYLTDKKTPTRMLIFFDHIKIPLEQEVTIIQELEKNKVNYVLMSNRIASPETGLGIFGQSYCPLISKYVRDNFVPIFRQGGDWQQPPGWAHNHGVIIFKRK